jgi:hypothetical protein
MITTFKTFLNESKRSGIDLTEVLSLIEKKNEKGIRKIIGESKYLKKIQSPTEIAENDTGIYGISHKYKMPYNLEESEIKTLLKECVDANNMEVRNRVFADLLYINNNHTKGMEALQGDKRNSVILGIVNRIPPKDILDFCQNSTEAVSDKEKAYKFSRKDGDHEEYAELFNSLANKNIVLKYYPSIENLKKILNYVEKHSN